MSLSPTLAHFSGICNLPVTTLNSSSSKTKLAAWLLGWSAASVARRALLCWPDLNSAALVDLWSRSRAGPAAFIRMLKPNLSAAPYEVNDAGHRPLASTAP